MSQSIWFECSHCGLSAGGWDDGDPWTFAGGALPLTMRDENGKLICVDSHQKKKRWPPMQSCGHPYEGKPMGNDLAHMCMDCGRVETFDTFGLFSQDPFECPKCHGSNLLDFRKLGGKTCPKCGEGTFHFGTDGAIS